MSKLMALIAAAGVLTAPSVFAAYDGTLHFTGLGGGNINGGGVFLATTVAQPGSAVLGSFGTFCLERNETISTSGTYDYVIGSAAIRGGLAGGNPDALSIGTAWLYSQFRANASFASTAQQKSDLQQAIWYLEEEFATLGNGTGVNGLTSATANGTAYVNAAIAATGKNSTTIRDNANGAYGVVVLNLYDTGFAGDNDPTHNHLRQSQLGIVPEASTIFAGALLLLPFAISTFRIMRKKPVA